MRGDVAAGELGALQIAAGEPGLHARPAHVGAFEDRNFTGEGVEALRDDGSHEAGIRQIGVREVGVDQPGKVQIGAGEVRARHVRVRELGAEQVGALEVGSGEVELREVEVAKRFSGKVRGMTRCGGGERALHLVDGHVGGGVGAGRAHRKGRRRAGRNNQGRRDDLQHGILRRFFRCR